MEYAVELMNGLTMNTGYDKIFKLACGGTCCSSWWSSPVAAC
jgi:hypothetical protein